MALLPVLLDMVEEIYNSLDENAKKNPNSLPLLFVPQRSLSGYPEQVKLRRQMRVKSDKTGCGCDPEAHLLAHDMAHGYGHGCSSRTLEKSVDFKVAIDVATFKPEEISVKVKGRDIIIEGKHEERQDELGLVSRQFSRRIVLQGKYDPETVSTFISADGKLIVKAAKNHPPPDQSSERVIHIQRLPATAVVEAAEHGWEKVEEAVKDHSKMCEVKAKE